MRRTEWLAMKTKQEHKPQFDGIEASAGLGLSF